MSFNPNQTNLILLEACTNGNEFTVSELISCGADLNCKKKGMTPFLLACLYDHVNIVSILIESEHCNINCTMNSEKNPGIFAINGFLLACEKQYFSIVQFFLQQNKMHRSNELLGSSPWLQ